MKEECEKAIEQVSQRLELQAKQFVDLTSYVENLGSQQAQLLEDRHGDRYGARNRSSSYDRSKKGQFIASTFTKDLKHGNLFKDNGESDRLASYGTGFSNYLSKVSYKGVEGKRNNDSMSRVQVEGYQNVSQS